MAHNRTVTFNTDSADIEKRVNSVLFYLNIAHDRILQDTEYPASNEEICTLAEAKQLIHAMMTTFTTPADDLAEDETFDLNVYIHRFDVA
jgi:hypothetical protein